jgi:hypothetical protein
MMPSKESVANTGNRQCQLRGVSPPFSRIAQIQSEANDGLGSLIEKTRSAAGATRLLGACGTTVAHRRAMTKPMGLPGAIFSGDWRRDESFRSCLGFETIRNNSFL